MKNGVNKVTLLGYLGADPDLKTGNVTRCVLSVGTSRSYRDSADQERSETEWHRVIVWRKQADACAKYLTKGSPVYIEGRIQSRSYEDGGQKKYVYEVIADVVTFLPNPNRKAHQGAA